MTHTADQPQWWKSSTVYQIYPRSFQDSNGDGIGDIPGITSRVPYLKKLGVDIVWLSPLYRSPMADMGYDIADYQDVDPMFGTLDDLDELITQLHAHDMRLIMDLVVNHTSNRHPWFQEALDPASDKRDWYIWRDPRPGATAHEVPAGQRRGDEPNDWTAAFNGPSWTWHEASQQYYLHLFAPEQPDLNWDNPQLRQAIFEMMRWWLDRGVDGFRMDVINLISKPEGFDQPGEGSITSAAFGPHFHEYIQQMHREVFDRYPDRVFFTVGETPGATPHDAILTSDPARRELDMIFQFEHMGLDSADGDKYHIRDLHLPDMKRNLARWSQELAGKGWNSLYLSNHDQPRPLSRYGDEENHRYHSATAWGAMLHAHPGTPFVFEGEEIGMSNYPWSGIDQFKDVETIGQWRQSVTLDGQDPQAVWPAIVKMSRDNARTPMQWDATENAGFTTGEPWLPVNPNYETVNAQAQVDQAGSTFEFYRAMIALRKEYPILVEGDFELVEPDDPSMWWVRRTLGDQVLDAVANMSSHSIACAVPDGDVILSNRRHDNGDDWEYAALAPWEVRWVIHPA